MIGIVVFLLVVIVACLQCFKPVQEGMSPFFQYLKVFIVGTLAFWTILVMIGVWVTYWV